MGELIVSSRGLPVCPDCNAEIMFTACGARTSSFESRNAILELVLAAHRKMGHCDTALSAEVDSGLLSRESNGTLGPDRTCRMAELPDVERAVVYTPQPGDRIVLEVADPMTREQVDRLKTEVTKAFGHEVQIVVLNAAHFVGVIRPDENPEITNG